MAALLLVHGDEVRFKKTVLDARFVSEGVAVADVDRDGKPDIIAGSFWYEAPDWKPHPIAPYGPVDPKSAWSDSFHNWAADLNSDGWPDQIVIGMPGEKAMWRENPAGNGGHWKEHLIWHSAGNESPLYVDLLKTGMRVLVMGHDDEHLAWFEPSSDPEAKWVPHNVSGPKGAGSQRYSHGLGVGDLDGDGDNEIVVKDGHYVASQDPRVGPWTFVQEDYGPDCAQMHVFDRGVLSTSAHARGVWWHRTSGEGTRRTTLDDTISVTHSAILTTIGGNPNLVTGKRKWAHPPGVDVGSEEPHWLVRYEHADGKWTRYVIDEDSGVGTQFVVEDVDRDGKLDIVTANKNGVFLFVQQ